ncbi:hypothetical protein EJ05DRAFT_64215 [Pseudovirgaria hyperparasitica]|uniref:Uncharacterized protein n=1 Tax=Pseudovirgaria hyperparasitica TaxID=470096 RepID=A0A6A6W2P5_9PEZI|nr:uncharacterized protein EJ05DRAFT_64215 [Pseudovirgaria hyperparasitica]KAF2756399.1 hypothetical protein EJ05DRAFT_64215 [Pseudovirgaria hyperparasitica]
MSGSHRPPTSTLPNGDAPAGSGTAGSGTAGSGATNPILSTHLEPLRIVPFCHDYTRPQMSESNAQASIWHAAQHVNDCVSCLSLERQPPFFGSHVQATNSQLSWILSSLDRPLSPLVPATSERPALGLENYRRRPLHEFDYLFYATCSSIRQLYDELHLRLRSGFISLETMVAWPNLSIWPDVGTVQDLVTRLHGLWLLLMKQDLIAALQMHVKINQYLTGLLSEATPSTDPSNSQTFTDSLRAVESLRGPVRLLRHVLSQDGLIEMNKLAPAMIAIEINRYITREKARQQSDGGEHVQTSIQHAGHSSSQHAEVADKLREFLRRQTIPKAVYKMHDGSTHSSTNSTDSTTDTSRPLPSRTLPSRTLPSRTLPSHISPSRTSPSRLTAPKSTSQDLKCQCRKDPRSRCICLKSCTNRDFESRRLPCPCQLDPDYGKRGVQNAEPLQVYSIKPPPGLPATPTAAIAQSCPGLPATPTAAIAQSCPGLPATPTTAIAQSCPGLPATPTTAIAQSCPKPPPGLPYPPRPSGCLPATNPWPWGSSDAHQSMPVTPTKPRSHAQHSTSLCNNSSNSVSPPSQTFNPEAGLFTPRHDPPQPAAVRYYGPTQTYPDGTSSFRDISPMPFTAVIPGLGHKYTKPLPPIPSSGTPLPRSQTEPALGSQLSPQSSESGPSRHVRATSQDFCAQTFISAGGPGGVNDRPLVPWHLQAPSSEFTFSMAAERIQATLPRPSPWSSSTSQQQQSRNAGYARHQSVSPMDGDETVSRASPANTDPFTSPARSYGPIQRPGTEDSRRAHLRSTLSRIGRMISSGTSERKGKEPAYEQY